MENKVNPYVLPASILIAAVLISGSVLYAFRSGGSSSGPQYTGVFINGAQPWTTFQTSIETALQKPLKQWPANVLDLDSNKSVKNIPAASDADNVMGDPKAKVTVIEYADYQCPFCARFFTDAEPALISQYVQTGKVKFIFRNFPFLEQYKPGDTESTDAAMAAECSRDQGKFWQYHDQLFATEHIDAKENSGNLNRSLFLSIAKNLNMDIASFTACLDSKKYAGKIKNDLSGGQAAGVNGTPATYVE